MFKLTLKAEDYNEILRLGKLVKPDRKNTHEELDNIAIYIDDPLVEGEALFCDNYLYGKFVFQIQEIIDTTGHAKPCVFMLPRQRSPERTFPLPGMTPAKRKDSLQQNLFMLKSKAIRNSETGSRRNSASLSDTGRFAAWKRILKKNLWKKIFPTMSNA